MRSWAPIDLQAAVESDDADGPSVTVDAQVGVGEAGDRQGLRQTQAPIEEPVVHEGREGAVSGHDEHPAVPRQGEAVPELVLNVPAVDLGLEVVDPEKE